MINGGGRGRKKFLKLKKYLINGRSDLFLKSNGLFPHWNRICIKHINLVKEIFFS